MANCRGNLFHGMLLWITLQALPSLSTEIGTHVNIRNAIAPGAVDGSVNNLVNFVNSNGLGGIDIDWEYPSVL